MDFCYLYLQDNLNKIFTYKKQCITRNIRKRAERAFLFKTKNKMLLKPSSIFYL